MSKLRKKDEKPIPAVGPGSRVSALPDQIKRHIVARIEGSKGYDLKVRELAAYNKRTLLLQYVYQITYE